MTVTPKYKIVNNNDIYWLNEISRVWNELAGVTARNKNKNASLNAFRSRAVRLFGFAATKSSTPQP